MLKFLFFINLIFIFCNLSLAQNLVPNHSFEKYNDCWYAAINYSNQGLIDWGTPKNTIEAYCSVFYHTCINIYKPNGASRYYDTIYHAPRSGQGFVLINLYNGVISQNLISHLQCKLVSPLKSNCFYAVSFYLKLIGRHGVETTYFNAGYTDAVGVYLSSNKINTSNVYLDSYKPQVENQAGRMLKDSMHYMLVTDTFKSVGNERWITIGNFKSNKNTFYKALHPPQYVTSDSIARYWIDDITVEAVPPPGLALALGKDSVVCDTSDLKVKLSTQEGFNSYLWSTGETSRSIVVNKLGKYTVQADFGCGLLYDTIEIKTLPKPSGLPLEKDTLICVNKPFKFNISAPIGYNTYTWSTGSKSKTIEIAKEGEYVVKGAHQCWPFYDTIRVSVFKPPLSLIQTSGDTSICAGDSIQVAAAAGFVKYFWNGLAGSKTYTVKEKGSYILKAETKEHCIAEDTLLVRIQYPPPSLDLPNDTTLCHGQNLKLDAGEKQVYDNYLWNNNSEERMLIVSSNGTFKVKISNQCFSQSDSINITFADCTPEYPNLITPNGDGKNETFIIKTPIERQLSFEVSNRWGQQIYKTDYYHNDWKPSNNLNDGIYFFLIDDVQLGRQYKGWVEVIK